jgi:hypothetical protein
MGPKSLVYDLHNRFSPAREILSRNYVLRFGMALAEGGAQFGGSPLARRFLALAVQKRTAPHQCFVKMY